MTRATRLLAPDPGWTVETDVVVVGSGVAGLMTALHATRAGRVLVVTKVHVDDGSTRWAQGGVAAALGADDSPLEHETDTLEAGVGICDVEAVRVLCEEGPLRLRELIALGADFDLDPSGELSLTREGGHHRDRIVHAGGDATGAEVSRALVAAVLAHPRIQVIEHALVLDLLRTADGRTAGVTLHVLGEGTQDGVGAVHARAVVLATGGMGQVFASTTNPSVSTGDGVALALRAGAEVTDLEFVQFHPTALWLGSGATGQQPLISEAVRGEGAFLVDSRGARVITSVDHPLADLAPRDVVAKAITRRMQVLGSDHVFLDARGISGIEARFPTIVARCREAGIDPLVDLIPVAPAAHYASGGVRTDLEGRTSVPGLYACGEVACTGVHGANRLASNSLLEGLVFAGRIGDDLERGLPEQGVIARQGRDTVLLEPSTRPDLAQTMTEGSGVLRSAESLAGTAKALLALEDRASVSPSPAAWEATGLHGVATALVAAASRREETRGAHWREDFPWASDAWRGHLVTTLEGTIYRPVKDHVTAPEPLLTLSALTLAALTEAGLDPVAVEDLARRTVAEDLAGGVDVTSVATVPLDLVGTAAFVPRASGVVAGIGVAMACVDVVGEVTWDLVRHDGPAAAGETVLQMTGPVRTLLTGERSALNLLCHLSGVATLTARWVSEVEGTGARIRDTRKTTPGLRTLEKAAVVVGGGFNHRMSLSDAALVKDNHVVAAGGVTQAFEAVRREFAGLDVEVECDTVQQVAEVVAAGADLVLLDNMSLDDLRAAVEICKPLGVRTEASGGLTLDRARAVAETGVDYLSVGALTHSAPVLDLGLDLLMLDREGG